jgi:hypothetical protein
MYQSALPNIIDVNKIKNFRINLLCHNKHFFHVFILKLKPLEENQSPVAMERL